MDARVGQGDQEKVSKCLGFQVVWGSKSSVVWGGCAEKEHPKRHSNNQSNPQSKAKSRQHASISPLPLPLRAEDWRGRRRLTIEDSWRLSTMDAATQKSAPAASSDRSKVTSRSDDDAQATVSSATAADEDFLIFGARGPNLFDNIALSVDSLLVEEISSLPLLPRTLSADERQRTPHARTGEEKLVAKLRSAYSKNLDLAETYCSRNIFTVSFFPKTKRRKVLDKILTDGPGDNPKRAESCAGQAPAPGEHQPEAKYPTPTGRLPSPDELLEMDKTILETRQSLQQQKKLQQQMKRRLHILSEASETLTDVKRAVQSGGNGEDPVSIESVRESVTKALKGHEDLKAWNLRAEGVIELLDQIKADREKERAAESATVGDHNKVTRREVDERSRKQMLGETQDSMTNLLQKLRGKS